MTPQLIALDLDGTLLTHDKKISPKNMEVVQALAAKGFYIILASGRMHQATAQYASLLELPPEMPVISYNGAMGRTHAGKPLFEWPVPADLATEIIEYCWKENLHLNFYHSDTLYVAHQTKWAEIYQYRTSSQPHPVGDLRQFEGKTPTKLIMIDTPAMADKLLEIMKERYGDRLYMTRSDDEYLELMSPLAGKGRALAEVARLLDVPRERCLAMGDNWNDMTMLQWAGHAVAMANARPDVLAQIENVAPHADEDGVAQYLSRWL